MPYAMSNGRRGHGRARPRSASRRSGHNPWQTVSSGKWVSGKRASRASAVRRKPPKTAAGSARAGKRLAGLTYFDVATAKAAGWKPKRKKSTKRASAKKGTSMTKHQKRVRAGKKAARTRKANLAKRSRAGKKSAKGRGRKGSRKLTIRRTKVRATIARVKRRGSKGKGKLVFLVKRGKLRGKNRRSLGRARVMFNARNPGGLVETLKSVFTMDTVKVLGGGIVGFSLAAGAGEALARKLVKNPSESKGAFVAVGLATGIGVAVLGGSLIGRYSPKVGQAFMWGSLLGTVIRALSAAFPGKTGLDMPATAADANALSMKLHALESRAMNALLAPAPQGAKDWLPAEPMGARGTEGYAALGQNVQGVQGWLDVGGGQTVHPALATVGGGQSW